MNRSNPYNWGCQCIVFGNGNYHYCSSCQVRASLTKEEKEYWMKEKEKELQQIES